MKRWVFIGAVLFGFSHRVFADSVQPIVPTGQVTYGSSQKLLTSNSDVLIDTTSHKFTANKGIKTSTITFADGTVLFSSNGITALAAWGSITGTITSQTDLIAKFNAVAVSTANIQTTVTAQSVILTNLAASTTTLTTTTNILQSQINGLETSTGTITTSVLALGVSTAATQSQVNSISVSTAALSVSTNTLQTQINNLGSTYLTNALASSTYLSTTNASVMYLSTSAAAAIYLSQSNAGTTYLTQSSATTIYQQQNQYATATSSGVLTLTDWNTFNNKGYGTITSILTTNGLTGGGSGPTLTISVSSVSLSTQTFGNLPMANINGGLNASATTYLRGDGTWVGIPTSAGAASISIFNGASLISSPTISVAADGQTIIAYAIGTSSAGFKVNSASVTEQGNAFNAANQLVMMTAGGLYPTANGNLITNLNGGNVTGTLPVGVMPPGSVYYAASTNTLQAGTTIYPQYIYAGSSATISGPVSAQYFIGDGSQLINLNASNIGPGSTYYAQSGNGISVQNGWVNISTITMTASSTGGGMFANYNFFPITPGQYCPVLSIGDSIKTDYYFYPISGVGIYDTGLTYYGGIRNNTAGTFVSFIGDSQSTAGNAIQVNGIQIQNYLSLPTSSYATSQTIADNTYLAQVNAANSAVTMTLPQIDTLFSGNYVNNRGGRTIILCKTDSSTNTVSFTGSPNPITPSVAPLNFRNECQEFTAIYVGGASQGYWQPTGRMGSANTANIYASTSTNIVSAGNIGEHVSSVTATSTPFPTSTNYGDLLSVTLSSGAWMVTFQGCEQLNGATLSAGAIIGISTTSGNSSTGLNEGDNQLQLGLPASTGDACQTISNYFMSFNSNTTIYAKYEDSFSVQTPTMRGRISVIRAY